MMKVALKNNATGEVRLVKVGFSWTLLFFAGFFGIPLFLRKLNTWGGIFLAVSLLNMMFSSMESNAGNAFAAISGLAGFGLTIFISIKGNEMTAKNLLENGWEFVDPESPAIINARAVWGLA